MKQETILKRATHKYDVNSYGDVSNKKTGRKLKIQTTNKGYKTFSVYMGNGVTKHMKVHRFVAQQYVDNPNDLPQVNHIDGDPSNNHFSNLEWCTQRHNVLDGFKRGRVTWNKGNISKRRIYTTCKKYHRQAFWYLTKNDFEWSKAFWKRTCDCIVIGTGNVFHKTKCHETDWGQQLQAMVLEKDPIKYLKKFI